MQSAGANDDDTLVISLYFHPEVIGSAPPITDLAWWFAERGLPVRVVTARPHYPFGEVYKGYRHGERDREAIDGIAIHRYAVPVGAGGGAASRLKTEAAFALRLLWARVSGAVAPSARVIVVCPSIFAVLVAPIFRRRGGRALAIVHDVQSGLATTALRGGGAGLALRLLRGVERFALDRVDTVVTLSDAMARILRGLGVRRPIEILPPQIDVREFDPQLAPTDAPPRVLYSGNFGRKQGLEQVLHLAAELRRRGSPAQLVLKGDGNQRADLEAAARDLALANVTFEPFAPRDEIAASFAAAAVHLLPQRAEGGDFAVPSKAFSIMAAARPFVCTASPDSPLAELARTTGAGAVVPPDDPVAFADAVEDLLADPARAAEMGRRGRDHVAAHVDREVVCARLSTLMVGGDAAPTPAATSPLEMTGDAAR
jgi:colanic acid biosynthesis glycosyl transferase WcaI